MKAEQAAAWLAARDRFLLVTHRNPDGDTMGSAAALCSALRRVGKTVYLHRARGVSEAFYRRMGFAPCGTWREYE